MAIKKSKLNTNINPSNYFETNVMDNNLATFVYRATQFEQIKIKMSTIKQYLNFEIPTIGNQTDKQIIDSTFNAIQSIKTKLYAYEDRKLTADDVFDINSFIAYNQTENILHAISIPSQQAQQSIDSLLLSCYAQMSYVAQTDIKTKQDIAMFLFVNLSKSNFFTIGNNRTALLITNAFMSQFNIGVLYGPSASRYEEYNTTLKNYYLDQTKENHTIDYLIQNYIK